jgi:hypothetical protein
VRRRPRSPSVSSLGLARGPQAAAGWRRCRRGLSAVSSNAASPAAAAAPAARPRPTPPHRTWPRKARRTWKPHSSMQQCAASASAAPGSALASPLGPRGSAALSVASSRSSRGAMVAAPAAAAVATADGEASSASAAKLIPGERSSAGAELGGRPPCLTMATARRVS